MLAIENSAGAENIDETVSVKSVDGIFIGPSDLSINLGDTSPTLTYPTYRIPYERPKLRQRLVVNF